MHEVGLLDFLNPQGFGYVKDRDHVAGYQEHQFRNMPELDPEAPQTQRWRIIKLELVSLLKYPRPLVYLSQHLPRMQELRQAKTRPLNGFEKAALRALREGEDLKVRSTPDCIRFLGSIRAGRQCLDCHQVERGDLLGAFSYQLRRQR
jgi:hypothetical protein